MTKNNKNKMLLNFSLRGKITHSSSHITDEENSYSKVLTKDIDTLSTLERFLTLTTITNSSRNNIEDEKYLLDTSIARNISKSVYLQRVASMIDPNRLNHSILTKSTDYAFVEK